MQGKPKGVCRLQIPEDWQLETRAENIPSRIIEMIDFWNLYGSVHFDKTAIKTKTFWSTVDSLRKLTAGSLYDTKPGLTPWAEHRFSVDDFKLSVKRFHRAAFLHDYKPFNKDPLRKINLWAFLNKKYFITFYENPPEPRFPLPEDKEPLITARLIHHYKKNVLGDEECSLLPHEKKLFIQATSRLLDFFQSNNGKIFGGVKKPHPLKMADYLWESIQTQFGDILHKVTPYWFSSEKTFTGPFRRYLNKEAILNNSEPRGPRIGDSVRESDAKIPSELLT